MTAGGLFGAYPAWALTELYAFACVSIVIAFIDLDHHLILNVVLLPTLIATVMLLAVKKVDLHGGIPFGPSMLLGAWLGILAGAPLATLYLQCTGLA